MKKELFDELLESVREGGAILRGEQEPSRRVTFEEPDVNDLRKKCGSSQPKFAASPSGPTGRENGAQG